MADGFSVEAVISAVDKSFSSTMNEAMNNVYKLGQASSNTAGSVQNSGNSMMNTFKGVATGMGAVAIAAKAFDIVRGAVGDAVSRLDTLNNSSRTFANMGFSAKETSAAMDGLKSSIMGLPTPLDQAVKGVQMIAASTGDLGLSQKVFSALNDSIIGFGGSTADVNNAVLQLSQAFANGKVDAMTWNSMLNSNMGPALNAVAKKMGITTAALKDGLSSGKISVKDFQQALVDLDNNGGGGLKSLKKIALDSTSGIGTSMQNAKTAIVRGIADALTAINKGLSDNGLPTIADMIQSAGNSIASVFSKLAKVIPPAIAAIAPFVKKLQPIAPLLKGLAAAFVGLGVIAMFSSKLAPAITVFSAMGSGLRKITGLAGGAASKLGGLFSKLNPFSSAGKAAGEGLDKTASGSSKVSEAAPKAASGASALAKNIALIGIGVGAAAAGMGLLVMAVTQLSQTGAAGAIAMTGVTVAVAALVAVFTIAGRTLGSIGPQAAIAYGGMAVLVASFALLTAAVTAFASTGEQGLVALAAITAAIVTITAVMAALSPVLTAGSVGLLAFGAAVLMVGAGIGLAAAGVALLVAAFNSFDASAQTIIATMTVIGQGFAMMFTSFITTLATQMPIIAQSIMQMLVQILKAFVQFMPQMIAQGTLLITNLLIGIAQNLPQIIAAAVQVIVAFVEGIAANLGQIITAALDLLQAFVEGLGENIPRIVDIAMEAVMYFVYGVGYALGRVLASGGQLIQMFIRGVMNGLNGSRSAGKSNADSAKSGIGSVSLVSAGADLIKGFINGIISLKNDVMAAARSIANEAKSIIKSALRIGSPSRVMMQYGSWFTEGFAIGITDEIGTVKQAAEAMTRAAMINPNLSPTGLQDSLSQLNGSIGGNYNGTLTMQDSTLQMQNNKLLRQLVNKSGDVYMDGQTVGHITAPTVSQDLGQGVNLKGRWS